MDTLKRLARWVLRKELQSRNEAHEYLQQMYFDAHAAYMAQRRENEPLRERFGRLQNISRWAHKNGNATGLAIVEYVDKGPKGTMCGVSVHPFDRWNVSPKP